VAILPVPLQERFFHFPFGLFFAHLGLFCNVKTDSVETIGLGSKN